MKKFFIFSLVMLSGTLVAQNRSINFETGSWDDILKKANAENKPVFLDAYASWCGPCKWMAKNIFTNDSVADYYNANFICAKIDMEKGEGLELAKRYTVRNYPTLIYLDGKGNTLHRTCGARKADRFIEEGKLVMNAEEHLAGYEKQFDQGKRDPEFVYRYFKMRAGACLSNDEVITTYFETIPEEKITDKKNWEIIDKFLLTKDSKAFDYIVNHREDLVKGGIKEETINKKILDVYENEFNNSLRSYFGLKKSLGKAKIEGSDKLVLKADMTFYEYSKDWEGYARTAAAYFENYQEEDWRYLNKIAWKFYENVEDPAMLEKAVEWAKRSVELHNGYANNDTYAALLYKLKKKEAAISAAEMAIQLAKKEEQDYSGTEELLQKIKEL